MDYSELKELSYAYADRSDPETTDKFDLFLKLVESRVNQVLQVQKQSCRTQLKTRKDQEYYGLPSDFAGLRDIEITTEENKRHRKTLEYRNPKQMNDLAGTDTSDIYYTIIADQIQIIPPQDDKVLEIVYYRNIPPLTETDNTNWLSTDHPDVYLFGVLVEISSFVKDPMAKTMWEERYQQSIMGIQQDDQETRWSGTPLQIKSD